MIPDDDKSYGTFGWYTCDVNDVKDMNWLRLCCKVPIPRATMTDQEVYTVVWCQTTSTIDDKYKDEDDYNSNSSTRSSASASTIRTKISIKTTANNLWPKIHCTFISTWTCERETKRGAEWGYQKLETRLPAIKRTTSTGGPSAGNPSKKTCTGSFGIYMKVSHIRGDWMIYWITHCWGSSNAIPWCKP